MREILERTRIQKEFEARSATSGQQEINFIDREF